jgi:hypothetical protein
MPANHWVGTQYLSLTAILTGQLFEERKIWTVLNFMAQQDRKDTKKSVWALATLIELYLLKPLIVPLEKSPDIRNESLVKATKYIDELVKTETSFPIESTIRQLDRYIHWDELECNFFLAEN